MSKLWENMMTIRARDLAENESPANWDNEKLSMEIAFAEACENDDQQCKAWADKLRLHAFIRRNGRGEE